MIPADPAAVAVWLWMGWLLTHLIVFSGAKGIFHEYYTTVMGPAVAALAGITLAALWRGWRDGAWRGWLLPAALILTAAWQAFVVHSDYPDAGRWLLPTVLTGAGVAAAGLLGLKWLTRFRGVKVGVRVTAAAGVAALLVGPASWSLAVLARPGNAVMPSAQEPAWLSDRPDRGRPGPPPFGGERAEETSRLVDFLRANHQDERFLVVGSSAGTVAPIIIQTGAPAAALGGFLGADPVVSKEEFARMVEEGQVRFVLVGGPGGPGRRGRGPDGPPPDGAPPPGAMPPGPGGPPPGPGGPPGGPPMGEGTAEVMAWVRQHGKEVDARLWRAEEQTEGPRPPAPDGPGRRGGWGGPGRPGGPREQLYDCRPELGLVKPNTR
jgi:4-amino-4-deoxy-L-arabinose transferase-like glycosyltransferase